MSKVVKVMQIENNYDRDVFNGDIGFVLAIDREEEELAVDFDGRTVVYPFGELDELVLCYATTIHKSQGSEYPVVVIPALVQFAPAISWRAGKSRGRDGDQEDEGRGQAVQGASL